MVHDIECTEVTHNFGRKIWDPQLEERGLLIDANRPFGFNTGIFHAPIVFPTENYLE